MLEAVTNTNSEQTANTNANENTNSSIEEELADANTPKIDEQIGKTKRTEVSQPPVKVSTPKPTKQVTAVKPPPDKKSDTKRPPVRGSSSDILP
jgi:hypothetical protein